MYIYRIIDSVASVSSTKTKQSILEANSGNETLRQVFFYTYNPRFNFWIKSKQVIDLLNDHPGNNIINDASFQILDNIINRVFTGYEARDYLVNYMNTLTDEAQIIFCRIIDRDLRCGASTSIANKVWKNLIPEYPVLLCSKYDAKAEKYLKQFENNVGFWVEKKCDGGRLIIEVDNEGTVLCRSRNGSILNLYGIFDSQLTNHHNMVFDGELTVEQSDSKPNRQLSNGFYTKAVRNTLSESEAKQFTFNIWDAIPAIEYSTIGTIPYSLRREFVERCNFIGNITQVYGEFHNTLAGCIEFYERMRSDGQEGCIIKVANSVWDDTRSKDYVKVKAEETGDFLCTGYEPGTGKYEGMIGSLLCESKDGKVKFSVGTGLKDPDRALDPKEFINRVIEVSYNQLIKSKGRDTLSVFLPVYKSVRYDKLFANTLEELK